jgi:hypothetical protein
MGFLYWMFITNYSRRFWWLTLRWIFIVPIICFTFFPSVYNFGPKHCKQLLIEILCNPIPGIVFKGHIGESNDFDSLKYCCFNHNLISWHIARDKHLAAKQATQSSTVFIHDCPLSNNDATAPKLRGYQTYATFNDHRWTKRLALAQRMPMTLYFATLEFSCPDIVFLSLPQPPPDEFITSPLGLILISMFFSIITIQTCFLLSYQLIKHICLTRSALSEKIYMVLRETLRRIHIVLKETLHRFDLILRELLHWIPHTLTFSATCTQLVGFTTIPSSTMAQIYANATLFFDTVSSFWVCNKSATGHICNDKLLFSGELVPSIYHVSTATGTSEPMLMGTVVL